MKYDQYDKCRLWSNLHFFEKRPQRRTIRAIQSEANRTGETQVVKHPQKDQIFYCLLPEDLGGES